MRDKKEGMQIMHTNNAFIFEFEAKEDRNYYVTIDPSHITLVNGLDTLIQKVQVPDFTPNVF